MHGSKEEVPMAVDAGGVVIRLAEWGGMNVALETFPAGTDTEPIFKDLPDDRCQSSHWGYVLKGRARVRYPDREEVLAAGDAGSRAKKRRRDARKRSGGVAAGWRARIVD